MTRDPEADWIDSLTPEQVRRELDERGIDTKSAVKHVLNMVREAKEKHAAKLRERN